MCNDLAEQLLAAKVRCLQAEQERDEIRATIREAVGLKDEALGLGVYRRQWARALDKLEEERRLREQAEARIHTLKKVLEAAYEKLLEKGLFPSLFPTSPADVEVAERIAGILKTESADG